MTERADLAMLMAFNVPLFIYMFIPVKKNVRL